MKTILCPVDASIPARHAVQHAAFLATVLHGRLRLLHVIEPVVVPMPGGFSPHIHDERAVRSWMAECEADAARLGVETDVTVAVGRPSDVILAAASSGVDLIVMATNGATGLDHLIVGSVTERVLRRSPCPVLTVTPHSRPPFTDTVKTVVCAVDFSDCALKALEFAMSTAIDARATLVLVHVLEWPWHEPPAPHFEDIPEDERVALLRFRQRRERDALRRLAALQPESMKGRCQAIVMHGSPHVELARVATERGADLIVLGVAGRSAVDLALFGSTANHIIRTAPCPVVTVASKERS